MSLRSGNIYSTVLVALTDPHHHKGDAYAALLSVEEERNVAENWGLEDKYDETWSVFVWREDDLRHEVGKELVEQGHDPGVYRVEMKWWLQEGGVIGGGAIVDYDCRSYVLDVEPVWGWST